MNTETNKTTSTKKSSAKKASAKTVTLTKVQESNLATAFQYFEGKAIDGQTYATAKKQNVRYGIAENFVLNIANNHAKLDKKHNTGMKVLNELRNGRFPNSLTANDGKRLKYYAGSLSRQFQTVFTVADVRRALMLGAVKLWNKGRNLSGK